MQGSARLPSGGGGIGILIRYGGISLFFLRYFGICLEKLRYYDIGNLAVLAILDSKTAVIDKICLQYYGIEYPPMPPSFCAVHMSVVAQKVGMCRIVIYRIITGY